MSLFISFLYPITLFFIIKYLGLNLDDMMVLKLLPLFVSVYVTLLIIISHIRKNSLIIKYAKRFSKQDLSEEEIIYIKKSTLFWIGISLINIVIHVGVLLHVNEYYWLTYTSVGWYSVFAFGGLLQYIHRKFVFLKRVKNV